MEGFGERLKARPASRTALRNRALETGFLPILASRFRDFLFEGPNTLAYLKFAATVTLLTLPLGSFSAWEYSALARRLLESLQFTEDMYFFSLTRVLRTLSLAGTEVLEAAFFFANMSALPDSEGGVDLAVGILGGFGGSILRLHPFHPGTE